MAGPTKLIRSPCRHIYLTVRNRVTLVKHGVFKQGMRLVQDPTVGTACLSKMVFDHYVSFQHGRMCPIHFHFSSHFHIVRKRDRDGRKEGSRRRKLSDEGSEGKSRSQTNTSLFQNLAIQQIHIWGYIAKDQKEATLHLLPIYSYTQF